MRTLGEESSSSTSAEKAKADPAGFAQFCCFVGANWHFSYMDLRRTRGTIFEETSFAPFGNLPVKCWYWMRAA